MNYSLRRSPKNAQHFATLVLTACLLLNDCDARCTCNSSGANPRYCRQPVFYILCGPGSSVGIAIDYGLDGPEIESLWG